MVLRILRAILYGAILIVLLPVSVVVYPLMRLFEEISGEGPWYRRQKQMRAERGPLPDLEYLCSVAAEPGEERLWLATRTVLSESVGQPPELIHPEDGLADLWRMQWLGPDILDLVFRLERNLGIKIPRSCIDRMYEGVHYGQPGDFREFATKVVRELRLLTEQEQRA